MENSLSIQFKALSPFPEGRACEDLRWAIEQRLSTTAAFRGITFSAQIIQVSIAAKDLVCFLDSLLAVLSVLEAEQVFAGMDTPSTLGHLVGSFPAPSPNPFDSSEQELKNLAGQTIEAHSRLASKYCVMLALIEALLRQDAQDLDRPQLASTLQRLNQVFSDLALTQEDELVRKASQLMTLVRSAPIANRPDGLAPAEPTRAHNRDSAPEATSEAQRWKEIPNSEAEATIKNELDMTQPTSTPSLQPRQPPSTGSANCNVQHLRQQEARDFPTLQESYSSDQGSQHRLLHPTAPGGLNPYPNNYQTSSESHVCRQAIYKHPQGQLRDLINGINSKKGFSSAFVSYESTLQYLLQNSPQCLFEIFGNSSVIEILTACFSNATYNLEHSINYSNGPLEHDPFGWLYEYFNLEKAQGTLFEQISNILKVVNCPSSSGFNRAKVFSAKAASQELKSKWSNLDQKIKVYLHSKGVSLLSQLELDLEMPDLVELGKYCLEAERRVVFSELQFYLLYITLQRNRDLIDAFSPEYESLYYTEFNYRLFFENLSERLSHYIGDEDSKMVKERDLTSLMIAVAMKLQRVDVDQKILEQIRSTWGVCNISDEKAAKRRIEILKEDNVPILIRRGIFSDVLDTLKLDKIGQKQESFLQVFFDSLSSLFTHKDREE
jgi:hypothetical protein